MSTIQTITPNPNRIFGLDLFRAIAIILVVKNHGAFLLDGTSLAGFPWFPMIDGVDLFFVLSGFLIGGILLNEINEAHNFGFKALTRFWKRRWLRTLPNYYLILLANYLVVYFGVIHGDINQFSWKFLVFLQNFATPFHSFFWESWSLAVEEWFYISAPLLLILFLRFLSPKKAFLLVTLLMILFPLLYRVLIFDDTVNDFFHYDVNYRKLVVTRLDSIAFGLLGAWIFYYCNSLCTKFKMIAFITGIALIVFLLVYESPYSSFYKQVICFTIMPIAAMLLLPLAQGVATAKGKIAAAVTHISKISYSMYLINLALAAEIIRDNFAPTGNVDGLLKYVLYWVFVVIASTLLYRYFEKPILNLRDRKVT